MASFGHIAIGLAGGRAFAGRPAAKGAMLRASLALSAISLWPDADWLGMVAGVPYDAPWGHRGATHSLFFAVVWGALAWGVARRAGWPPLRTAVITFLVAVSHCLFDGMTFGGGLGCAYLWPFSDERLWLPLRFIPVAPLGRYMFSERGAMTVLAELVIFSPFLVYATFPARKPKA